jgi:N-acylneuraminate cytidylyltransferase
MNVAIIPARGGSQRIPRKNIREFCGKPMLAWSIEAAAKSDCFARIIVSTDDQEIAELARHYGAEVPFLRPALLADSKTGMEAVVLHGIEWLEAAGTTLDYVCCVFATAPFLAAADLRDGLTALEQAPNRQFSLSVTRYPFPIQRAVRITADGGIAPFSPESMQVRSQDLDEAFHEAGQFFWARPEAMRRGVSVYTAGASVPVVVPRWRVQDIDTMEDWVQAELMFRSLRTVPDDAGSL